jgi:cation transporter-like permease
VHVADRRGLTAVGAVTLALVLGAAGGFVDVMTGPGLRTVFAVCFVAGCAIAALKAHREDLVATVVMPPLVYAVIALLAGAFSQTAAVGGMLTRQALELATSLVLGAPVLLTATGLAFVIAVVRGLAGRGSSAPAED